MFLLLSFIWLFPYAIACIIVAIIADSRKIGAGWTLLISIIFSPLVGLIVALASERKPKEDKNITKNKPHLRIAAKMIKSGNVDTAKKHIQSYLMSVPYDGHGWFEMAKIHAIENNIEEFYNCMEKSWSNGFRESSQIFNSKELRHIVKTKDFADFSMNGYKRITQ